jgi:hypothetical protein
MSNTIVKDKEYKKAIKDINNLNNCFVKIGYPFEKGSTHKIHKNTDFTIVKLASIHEFGAKIKHPGGTLFSKNKKGQVRFTKQGGKVKVAGKVDKNRTVMGITGEHAINIPERSFIRKSFDIDRSAIENFVKNIYIQYVDGKLTKHKSLSTIGQFGINSIKKYFPRITPLLSLATIRKKGSSAPLIDSSIMRNSITFSIHGETK